jgi:hypothetical protein
MRQHALSLVLWVGIVYVMTSALHQADAQQKQVASDSDDDALKRALEKSVKISGVVFDSEGSVVPGARILVTMDRGLRGSVAGQSKEDGTYEVNVREGKVLNVSYSHALSGTASVQQLSGKYDQHIYIMLSGKLEGSAAVGEMLREIQGLELSITKHQLGVREGPLDVSVGLADALARQVMAERLRGMSAQAEKISDEKSRRAIEQKVNQLQEELKSIR